MLRYIFKRIILAILTLIILVTLVYFLIASFAKNPFAGGDPDNVINQVKIHGLDKPVIIRFGKYIQDVFNGSFGEIYVPKGGESRNIPLFFFLPLRYTLLITIPAVIFSLILGIGLGVIAGYKRGTWVEGLINIFVMFFVGLPSFVLAPIAIMIAINSNGFILPSFQRPEDVGWLITLKSLFLPILIVTLVSLAAYTILTRNQMVSILTSNQVLIAKSKGLSSVDIFFKYILRNISIPILSFIFPSFLALLAGNIVIEQFFNVPGSSSVIIQAFPSGEINVVMFSIIFYTSLSLISQIILDITYLFIDPRIIFIEKGKINNLNNFINWVKVKQNYKHAMKQKKMKNNSNRLTLILNTKNKEDEYE